MRWESEWGMSGGRGTSKAWLGVNWLSAIWNGVQNYAQGRPT